MGSFFDQGGYIGASAAYPQTVPYVYSNPESTLGAADYTLSPGFSGSVGSTLEDDFVIAIDITINNGDLGCITEIGGTTRGAGIAFDGTNIRTGAFYTAAGWNNSNYACLTQDFSSYLGSFGTLFFTGNYSAGTTNLYWIPGGSSGGAQAILLGTAAGGGNGAVWGGDAASFFSTSSYMQSFGFTGDTNAFNGSTTDAQMRLWRGVSEPSPLQVVV